MLGRRSLVPKKKSFDCENAGGDEISIIIYDTSVRCGTEHHGHDATTVINFINTNIIEH